MKTRDQRWFICLPKQQGHLKLTLAGNEIPVVTSKNTHCPPASLSESRTEQSDELQRLCVPFGAMVTAMKFHSNTYLHIGKKAKQNKKLKRWNHKILLPTNISIQCWGWPYKYSNRTSFPSAARRYAGTPVICGEGSSPEHQQQFAILALPHSLLMDTTQSRESDWQTELPHVSSTGSPVTYQIKTH